MDKVTRYWVLQVSEYTSMKSAIAFIEESRRRLPMAIQRIQIDHGSKFGPGFAWNLQDFGTRRRPIPRRSQGKNGEVKRTFLVDGEELCRRVTSGCPQNLAQRLPGWEHGYDHR